MLKANSLSELCSLMNTAEPGQAIQVPAKLFFEFRNKSKNCTFVQNFKQSVVETTYCNNIDEAQALANFLWNEGRRHSEDIKAINEDLDLLWKKWKVGPSCIKAFVKP